MQSFQNFPVPHHYLGATLLIQGELIFDSVLVFRSNFKIHALHEIEQDAESDLASLFYIFIKVSNLFDFCIWPYLRQFVLAHSSDSTFAAPTLHPYSRYLVVDFW